MVAITNAIKLRSWSGSYSNTIINGNFPAWMTTVVVVDNTNAVLDGLTITNGFDPTTSVGPQPGVGGVYFKGALITNCLITGNIKSNTWAGNGSGVLLANGIVTHCTIDGNRHVLDNGQALSFNDNAGSGPRPTFISNCVFTRNGYYTGGYPNSDGAAMGIYRSASRPGIVTKSVISNNYGHGIEMLAGGMTLSDCVLTGNGGSGVRSYASASSFTVRNCLFIENVYNGFRALCTAGYSLKFENCTFVSNGAHYGYGLMVYDETAGSGAITNSTVANCIIYDNYYQAPGTVQANWYDNKGTNPVFTNCCTIPMPTNQVGRPQGTGNITSAPMFVSPKNYHLSSQSPCINKGAYRSWMDGMDDLDGNKRVFEGIVDMGAYEFRHRGTMFRIQ